MLVLVAPLTKAGFAPFGEVVETADVKPKLINEGFAERLTIWPALTSPRKVERSTSVSSWARQGRFRSSSSSWSATRSVANCSCR